MDSAFFDWLQKEFGISQEEFNKWPDSQKTSYFMYYSKLKASGIESNPIKDYAEGNISAIDLQKGLGASGMTLTPESSQWLNNQLAIEQTEAERQYNTSMRDSSLTSAASQLSSLGLNPASVISTGGAGIGSTGAVADTSKKNVALEKQMQKFQQTAAMTRTLVGLAGGLGSAGVFGASRVMTQKVASAAAAAASHSGLELLKTQPDPTKSIDNSNWEQKWRDIMNDL